MFPKKYSNLLFILIMGFGMSLLMTLIITYVNTGLDNDNKIRNMNVFKVGFCLVIRSAILVETIWKKFVEKRAK